MVEDTELVQMLAKAQEAVKKAKITDKDLKVEAYKYALNFLWAKKYGSESKKTGKKAKS
ncbi:MAG TPA: hypothetical protein VLF90_02805 [Patescibacteria group bacterium]|nr:hypothetical protein [Patescibacteria group bacterium]